MVSQSSLPVTHTKLRNGLWCVSLINPFPNIPASYSLPSPGFKCLYYLVHAKLLQSCPTLWDPIYCDLPGSSVHGDSPGKNTGVDCHALLQSIFPTQGWNPRLLCLLHWQVGSTWEDPLLPHLWAGPSLASQSCLTLCNPMDCSLSRFSVRGDSPGKSNGVGYRALLQEILPNQELNLGLLHWKLVTQSCPTLRFYGLQPVLLLCPWNSPGMSTGVDCCVLLQGIFPAGDRTQVSHIASRFFIIWAIRKAHEYWNG